MNRQHEAIREILSHLDIEAKKLKDFVKRQRRKSKEPLKPKTSLPDGEEFALRSVVAYACGNGNVDEWWENKPLDEVFKWVAVRYAEQRD